MAITSINIGQQADDGTGDYLRTAFDKSNRNFDELAQKAEVLGRDVLEAQQTGSLAGDAAALAQDMADAAGQIAVVAETKAIAAGNLAASADSKGDAAGQLAAAADAKANSAAARLQEVDSELETSKAEISTINEFVAPASAGIQYQLIDDGAGGLAETDADGRMLMLIDPEKRTFFQPIRAANGVALTRLTKEGSFTEVYERTSAYDAQGLAGALVDTDEDGRVLRISAPFGIKGPNITVTERTNEYDLLDIGSEISLDADGRLLSATSIPQVPRLSDLPVRRALRIAYEGIDESGKTQIYVENVETGSRVMVSSSDSNNFDPRMISETAVMWRSDRALGAPGGLYASDIYNPAEKPLLPFADIVCWGDSMTAGGYPQRLAAKYGRTTVNRGVSGQTSSQAVARQGGDCALLTVSGNQIPASGAVVVTAQTVSPVTSGSSGGLPGFLAGVPGVLTRDDSQPATVHNLTFTRSMPGQAVSCPANTPFIPDSESLASCINVFFMGVNNRSQAFRILADHLAAVAHLKSFSKRFVVVSMTNSAVYPRGTPGYSEVMESNAKLAAAFPDNYLDMRASWVSKFNPAIPQDVIDNANDVPPSSLRGDALHPNAAGNESFADDIYAFIKSKGW